MADSPASAKRPHEGDENAEHRPVKRPTYDYNDTFSVLVGPEEKCFTIHKEVVCSKSKFFRAACSERWRSGQDKIVRLPDVETMVFQRYVDWAYCDILVSGQDISETVALSIKLYLLGDKLDDVKLRNKIMKALTSYSVSERILPGIESVKLIWSNTTPSSPLRKWIIDGKILNGSRGKFEENLTNHPTELLQQLALKLMQQTPLQFPRVFQAKLPEYLEAEDSE